MSMWLGVGCAVVGSTPAALLGSSLPTLKLEYDARNLALSNGAAVSAWANTGTVGSTGDMAQGTGANQPVYSTTGMNGLPTVTFDGSNDFMASGSIASSTLSASGLWSVFLVVKWSTTGGANICAFDHDNGLVTGRSMKVGASNTTARAVGFDTSMNPFVDTETGSNGTGTVLSVVRDSTSIQLWVNGTSGGSTATTGTPFVGATTVPLRLGCNQGTGEFWNSAISYAAYSAGAASTVQRQAMEASLKAIWGTP